MGATNEAPAPYGISGTPTLASLPIGISTSLCPVGTLVQTSDAGTCKYTGKSWVQQTTSLSREGLRSTRPLFVGAIGDSITQKNQLIFDTSTKTASQLYAITDRTWQAQAWLMYGACRSGGRWAAWDFNPGHSGAFSATVLSTVLPAFLNYPNGLPDACVVLAGTNDTGNSVAIATTLSNLKQIYTQLRAAGVTPIAAAIPPNVSGSALAMQLNVGIAKLAAEMNIPFVNFYGALINPANGQLNTNYSADGTHPTARGAAVMGYKLNEAVLAQVTQAPSASMTEMYAAGLATNLANTDPNLLTITGTINTGSSYPSAAMWSVPADPTMCKMNSGAGTEPGTGLTMIQPTPNIMGDAQTPNYVGNSFTASGNGTAACNSVSAATCISYNVGDRIAFSFRLKSIMTQGQTNPGVFNVMLKDNTLGNMAGWFYDQNAGNLVTNGQASIGNEAAYPAGDFYSEFTVPPGVGGLGRFQCRLSTTAAGNTSNVGDSVTIANVRIVNLTQLGIAPP